ncbi:MAG: glycosyltransferase [Candidatus Omnitrophota bacterium]|jgi:hypothetical protein
MKFAPKVSIIIPVYNGKDYLKEAIDSALAQTYENCEVIVVNDGSADAGETEAIALSYGEKLRYLRKTNGGVSTALNLAIKEMKGEYFSWLSHDDVYLPEKLEVQINYLRESVDEVENSILYTDFYVINEQSKIAGEKKAGLVSPDAFAYMLITKSFLYACTLLIPKRCLEKVGGFDERLRLVQDYKMIYELFKLYPFRYIPMKLVKFRIHKCSQGARQIQRRVREENELFIWAFDNYLKGMSESVKGIIGFSYLELAKSLKNRRCMKAAFHVMKYTPLKLWRDKLRGYGYCCFKNEKMIRRVIQFLMRLYPWHSNSLAKRV